MSIFNALMGVAGDKLRAQSPAGAAIGDAIGNAITERAARKRNERARTASLRQLNLDQLSPDHQRARILAIAADAGFIREDD